MDSNDIIGHLVFETEKVSNKKLLMLKGRFTHIFYIKLKRLYYNILYNI